MYSCNYAKILEMIKNLSNSAKRKLLLDISLLISLSLNKAPAELSCPHCHNKYIVKNGKNKSVQRYLCKRCRRSFVASTNTPIFSSKKDISVWLKFIDCLINQYSVKRTSKMLKISVSTAFLWRHKVLDAIRENLECSRLDGKVECTETFFQESFKGNHKSDGFVMPRKAHKRGGEGGFIGLSQDKVCVLTALDHENSIFIAPISMGKPSSNDLIRSVGKVLKPGSTLISKNQPAYKTLSSYCKLRHLTIPIGVGSFKSFNKRINIRKFIKVYKGVSTKYLANYMALYKYIFDKIDASPLLIIGEHTYKSTNFRGRPPIFK